MNTLFHVKGTSPTKQQLNIYLINTPRAYPKENLSLGAQLATTVATSPASRAVQSKNMWNESEMRPRLLVHIPYSSSTNANERLIKRKKKRFLVAGSERMALWRIGIWYSAYLMENVTTYVYFIGCVGKRVNKIVYVHMYVSYVAHNLNHWCLSCLRTWPIS